MHDYSIALCREIALLFLYDHAAAALRGGRSTHGWANQYSCDHMGLMSLKRGGKDWFCSLFS